LRWVTGRRRTFSAYYSGKQAEKWRLGQAGVHLQADRPRSVEEKIQHLQQAKANLAALFAPLSD